jgi:hypothetical protein
MAFLPVLRRLLPLVGPPSQSCATCGTLLDTTTAVELRRTNEVYCCRCYLYHAWPSDTVAQERPHGTGALSLSLEYGDLLEA